MLRAKGFSTVIEADFLTYAQDVQAQANSGHSGFDCVVMNPPFSEGRAKLHTEAASTLTAPEEKVGEVGDKSKAKTFAFYSCWCSN